MRSLGLSIHGMIALIAGTLLASPVAALPPVASGLIAAFDDSNIATSGTSVTSWNDISGNSNNAVQGLWASQPTLVSASTPGGTDAVQFDGTDDFLDIAADPTNFDGNQFSWYMVYMPDLLNDRRLLSTAYTDIDDVTPGDQYSGQLWANIAGSNNCNRALARDRDNGFHAANTPDDSMNTSNFFVAGGSWDGTNSTTDNLTSIVVTGLGSRVTGTTDAYGTSGNAIPSGHLRTRIGAAMDFDTLANIDEPTSEFAGQIAEILLYDRLLNASEQTSVEDYLYSKHCGVAPSSYLWNTTDSGNWTAASNWTDSFFAPPNDNNTTALFGDAIGSATKTIFTDEAVTLNAISIENTLGGSYAIAGAPAMTLATSDAMNTPTISVAQGNHQFQIALNLGDDTDVTVTSGTLDFNNKIDLNGSSLSLSGNVNINHSTTNGGSVSSLSGVLGTAGSTTIAGDLIAADTLLFDLGPANTDFFHVAGTATLSGTLDVELEPGFTPSGSYTLVTAGTSLNATGLSLDPSDTSTFTLSTQGNSLLLTVIGLIGDFDDDGVVDGSDFLAWQRGESPDPLSQSDLDDWQLHFGEVASSMVAVPEPTSLSLLLAAALVGFYRIFQRKALGIRRTIVAVFPVVLFFPFSFVYAQTTDFNGVQVPGVVINHSPASSEIWVTSPSIAILPNGDYVASHNDSGPNSTASTSGLARLFRSTDQGQTWTSLSTIDGQFWSNLFVHNNDLYMMGTDRGSLGNFIIRRSTDGGTTWTTPNDANTGLLKPSPPAHHTAPVPVVVHNGRIWRSFEDKGAGGDWPNYFRAGMMSAPVDANLLNASSWTFTNTLVRDVDWLPGVPGPLGGFDGWLEGNAVVDPNGQVVNVLRVDVDKGMPEKAAIARVTSPSTITFDPNNDIVDMPGSSKKFSIRYHQQTDRYWTLANIITEANEDPTVSPSTIRNIVASISSEDLRTWRTERTVIEDLTDVDHIAFSYLDWQFEGNDMVAVSRTAHPDGLGGANSFHDANFLTFHRVADILQPYSWNTASSGIWTTDSNWTLFDVGPPNDNNLTAVFGDVIGSVTRTIVIDEAITVNAISLENTLGGSYIIAGGPALTLAPSDTLVSPAISVAEGDHQFQVALSLEADTSVTVTSGTLDFNNQIDLNGYTLTLSGNININHSTVNGGSVSILSGALGTTGSVAIGGDLTVSDSLVFNLGASNADSFNVAGAATLSGTLDVELEPGFTPSGSYILVTTGIGLDATGLSLDPSDASMFTLSTEGTNLLLTVSTVPEPSTLVSLVASLFASLIIAGRAWNGTP